MRLVLIIAILAIIAGCTNSKHASGKAAALNGDWVPVKQEIGGAALPKAAFEKQRLTITDSMYTLVAESTDKGVLRFKDDKMDIYGKEGVNAGKHFTAIYKLENGALTICYNLKGDAYPESFDTKSKPLYFLSVFEKGK